MVRDAALHAQKPVELQVGMEKQDAAAKLRYLAADARAIGGVRLAGKPFGVHLELSRVRLQGLIRHGFRHVVERPPRKRKSVIGFVGMRRYGTCRNQNHCSSDTHYHEDILQRRMIDVPTDCASTVTGGEYDVRSLSVATSWNV